MRTRPFNLPGGSTVEGQTPPERFMDRLLPDIAHAVRRLLRAPGFAAIAVLTLALGIGANTAIFSLVKTVILRPLPYGNPERLVMIWQQQDKGETTWLSTPEVNGYAG